MPISPQPPSATPPTRGPSATPSARPSRHAAAAPRPGADTFEGAADAPRSLRAPAASGASPAQPPTPPNRARTAVPNESWEWKDYAALGEALEAQGRLQEAVDAYWEAYSHCYGSKDPGVCFRLGVLYDKLGVQEKAAQWYGNAVFGDPSAYEDRLAPWAQKCDARGLEAYGRREDAEAEVSFRQALKVAPRNAHYKLHLGQALYYQKKYTEALPFIAQAAAKLPVGSPAKANAELFYRLGSGLEKFSRKDYGMAVYYFEQAFPMAPTDSTVLTGLAQSHRLSGWHRKACEYLQKSVDLGDASMLPYLRYCEARATPAHLGYTLQDRLAEANRPDLYTWSGRRKAKPLLKSLIEDLGEPAPGSEMACILSHAYTTLAALHRRASNYARCADYLRSAARYAATDGQRETVAELIGRYT